MTVTSVELEDSKKDGEGAGAGKVGRSGEQGGYQKTGTQSVTTHRHQYDMDVEEMLYGDGNQEE